MDLTRIRALREDNDKTQQEIADLLCIKQTTYSKYELGRVAIPIDALMTLADFYGVSLDYLAGCCFSKRMRKVFKKNEKSMLQFCNKNSKKKRAFTMG